jgi:site-specific recombinase XerC
VTIGARLACLSSYLRFLIRMKVIAANPCDAIERPKAQPGIARGLCADQIRRLLAVLPDTAVGLRDRAIILTQVFTGRRRSEVLGMTAGSLSFEDAVYYSYRGKGGKTGSVSYRRRPLRQSALGS